MVYHHYLVVIGQLATIGFLFSVFGNMTGVDVNIIPPLKGLLGIYGY